MKRDFLSVFLFIIVILNAAVIFYNSSINSESSNEASKYISRIFLIVSQKTDKDNYGELEKSGAENIATGHIPEDLSEISSADLNKMNDKIRTYSHSLEFMTLGFFSFLFAMTKTKSLQYHFSMLYTFLFTALYAVSDEWHQLFVEGRSFQVSDILLDCVGSSFGVLFACTIFLILKKSNKNI